jgi:hypothetical protein
MYRSIFSWPRHYKDGSGQLQAQAALPLEKDPLYTLNRSFGRPQCRSRHCGEETFLDSTGAGTQRLLHRPARSQSCYTDCDILILISVARYDGYVLLQFCTTNFIIWKRRAFIIVSHGNMAFLSWHQLDKLLTYSTSSNNNTIIQFLVKVHGTIFSNINLH